MNERGVQIRAIEGRRSSQAMGKSVIAEAVRFVDDDLARTVDFANDWRKDYLVPMVGLVRAGIASEKDALRIAGDGLHALRSNLEFVRDGGAASLDEALDSGADEFDTVTIAGTATDAAHALAIPYRGEALSGDSLQRQLDDWVARGVMEPSSAVAVHAVVANPDWLNLSDLYFVLLGAASEMGPLSLLMGWGANVIAVELPKHDLWERIVTAAANGSGKLFAPVRRGSSGDVVDRAGADLLMDTPEINRWLASFDGSLVISDDTYADGTTFLRLAGANDALISSLARDRDVSLAYLLTPTDAYAVPSEVVQVVDRRGGWRSAPQAVARSISLRRLYSPNYDEMFASDDGRTWSISDALVVQQGPNYALAKATQRWRAIVGRHAGTTVSANVAPPTNTRSVTKNKVLAAAYRGAPSFGVEVFEPTTSSALMAALLIHDLRALQPEHPHPFDLYAHQAAHGGIWRLAHKPRTVLPLAVVSGTIRRG